MELQGSAYLYNLSLVAITFTAVSALVMLMRQTMGGALSKFDVYLISAYISFGFAQTIMALLPPLFAFFEPSAGMLWSVSSIAAAIILGSVLFSVVKRRLRASAEPVAALVRLAFTIHGCAVALLLVNAVARPWQGIHLYAAALTLSLANTMWSFVRRIASLFGERPGQDWDPKAG